jgi:hypothetical protein
MVTEFVVMVYTFSWMNYSMNCTTEQVGVAMMLDTFSGDANSNLL